MTVADQIRYNRTFQKVVHKGRESEINYTKIFQNAEALEILVVNIHTEDKLMHTFVDNFRKGGNYHDQIANHQG